MRTYFYYDKKKECELPPPHADATFSDWFLLNECLSKDDEVIVLSLGSLGETAIQIARKIKRLKESGIGLRIQYWEDLYLTQETKDKVISDILSLLEERSTE